MPKISTDRFHPEIERNKYMNEIKQNKMQTMPIPALIISMSLPMMLSMLIQALYNIVDSIFISRVSEAALTADHCNCTRCWYSSRYKLTTFQKAWRAEDRRSHTCCRDRYLPFPRHICNCSNPRSATFSLVCNDVHKG